MRLFSPDQLCVLADAYCAATGASKSAVAKLMGRDDKFFSRLDNGAGCHSGALLAASHWFTENWPPEAAWPERVPSSCDEDAAR